MSVSAKIKHYLDKHRLSYHILSHDRTVTLHDAAKVLQISPVAFARAVVLEDTSGYLMAVLPLDRKIDFGLLYKLVQRKMSIAPRVKVDKLFSDCEPGSHPPLGDPYTIPSIIDESLLHAKTIYFEPGSHTAIVQMGQNDFHYLTSNAVWGNFSVPISHPNEPACHFVPQQELTDALIRLHNPCLDRLAEHIKVPDLSPMAIQWMTLSQDPQVSSTAVLSLLKADSFALQSIEMFSSICAGKESALSLEAQIDQVFLGSVVWQSVAALATALHRMKIFHIQTKGSLGAKQLWLQSFLGTAAALYSTQQDPSCFAVSQSDLLLGACLHNLGFWMVGHCYHPEYALLNKMFLVNPNAPIVNLEQRLLGLGRAQKIIGCGHARIGGWLMQKWGFSDAVVTMISEHHTTDYQGTFLPALTLVQGLDFELKRLRIGDGSVAGFSWPLYPSFDQLATDLPVWLEDRVALAEAFVDILISKIA